MKTNDKSETVKVLIVDDSPDMIYMLDSILSKSITRQIALSGKDALKILHLNSQQPDLILLDVLMPEMDGYEVCRQIKMHSKLKDIPIVFISALNETFDKVKAFKLGAIDYITKPFQAEEVKARVSTHIEISRSRRAIRDLYSKTIQGTISAINDMLSMVNPEVSKISNMMRSYAELILKELSMNDAWDLKLACQLSGIGMMTENIKVEETRHYSDMDGSIKRLKQSIAFDVNRAYESLPLSAKIIGKIPNLDAVTEIINQSTYPLEDSCKRTPIAGMPPEVLKGHILRILIYYFYKMEQDEDYLLILKQMKNSNDESFHHDILDALTKVQVGLNSRKIMELKIDELRPKMIIANDLFSSAGQLLLKSGYELSESIILLLESFEELRNVRVKVIKKD